MRIRLRTLLAVVAGVALLLGVYVPYI
jgi:hypothetical protein